MNNLKDSFVTNLLLNRIGRRIKIKEFMVQLDFDPRNWNPPFTTQSINNKMNVHCTGKHITDGVESLLGAIFLSNNLYTTLKFISDIQLVPLQ
jgi:dsRNA-specific ribonuclease